MGVVRVWPTVRAIDVVRPREAIRKSRNSDMIKFVLKCLSVLRNNLSGDTKDRTVVYWSGYVNRLWEPISRFLEIFWIGLEHRWYYILNYLKLQLNYIKNKNNKYVKLTDYFTTFYYHLCSWGCLHLLYPYVGNRVVCYWASLPMLPSVKSLE